MEPMNEILLTAVIAFLLGALVVYALMSSKVASAQAQAAGAEALSRDREGLALQFRALTQESMEQHTAKAAQAVDPLATTLKELNWRITQVEKERAAMTAELREQIHSVRLSGDEVRREALALSTALRAPQVRGAWGEQSLRRVVEIAGLTARCHFDEQTSYGDGTSRLRPDMRINLADGKVVFVDAKVPLAAVLDAYNTDDAEQQEAHLARFARHVKGHIDALGRKAYWALDIGSPEFVVLYLPSDEFYRLATDQLPDLHHYAARRNIVLSCPGTLIPLLHVVAHGWKQVALAESAAEISRLGRELHDRLGTMGSHMIKLQRSIEGTVNAYNQTVASMESRVFVTARKFEDLGVTSEELPELGIVEPLPRSVTAGELTG